MFRFHDFNNNQLSDFWKIYYQHTDLINIQSFANQVLASKSGGYDLLQAYDILNIGEHIPGQIVMWELLKIRSYRYIAEAVYPHSYSIPTNILSIQTINDSKTNPTLNLQTLLDFKVDEDYPGIIRFTKDIPTESLLVGGGILNKRTIYKDENVIVKPIFKELIDVDDYGYNYIIGTIENTWERIDTLILYNGASNEKVYYNNIDYVYDETTGIVKFKIKLPTIPIYIAKGTVIGTRLFDDYGNLLGYKRYDSTWYRDSLVALSSLFNVVPSIPNIKAAANIAFKLPVAKYGAEQVMSLRGSRVLTDKYEYKLESTTTDLKLGDTLSHNEMISNAIELATNRTHPLWWEDRLPELFQKYSESILTPSRKNRMMETFLKRYLAHVRLDLRKIDTTQLTWQPDVWDLLFDGLPVRSDIILSTYYKVEDLDLPVPDYEKLKMRVRMYSIWQGHNPSVNPDLYIPTREIVKHKILPDGTGITDWYIGSPRYKIVGANEQYKQFWSEDRIQTPYVEPNFDKWWHKSGTTTDIKMQQYSISDINLVMPSSVRLDNTVHTATGNSPYLSDLNDINSKFSDTSFSALYIPSDITLDYTAFESWTLSGTWLGIDGIVVPFGTSGTATSQPINLGLIPKSITVDLSCDLPYGTSVELYYSLDSVADKDFIKIPIGFTVAKTRGQFRIQVKLSANLYNYPILKEVNLGIHY